MEAEHLAAIARGMGYEVRLSKLNEPCTYDDSGGVWVVKRPPFMTGCYNPLTNAEQMVEIMEKLKVDVRPINNFWVASARGSNTSKADTINEAVCLAAYSYFKEGEDE